MSLSKKYGIPQEKINQLIKDGVISCSWPEYEQVYSMYQESKNISGKTKCEIAYEIAAKTNISWRHVIRIIDKF